ncbi:hypothetical protein WMY93_032344 [Mugilogobius chulae]|uniref:RFX-type winged-helix domain-containing protein n=1 Tax=Mugilogobius chulae TaxID=88201 RepID=A0AAW0ML25_9GOBI
MAEESAAHPDAVGLEPPEGDTEPSMLLQKLKNNISRRCSASQTTTNWYLYLQLPSGPNCGDKRWDFNTGTDCGSLNTTDQLHTCNWIRSHLEEHSDTCLPKQDVYETYKRHCENLQHRPLSAANFGKNHPRHFDIKSELTELVQTYKQEVTEAACELICDWAQKILKRSFDTVVEIARYLIQEHIVNPRCAQAELVSGASLAGCPAKPYKVIKKTSGSKLDSDSETKKDSGDSCVPSLKSDRVKASEAQASARPAVGRRLAGSGSAARVWPLCLWPDSLSLWLMCGSCLAPSHSLPLSLLDLTSLLWLVCVLVCGSGCRSQVEAFMKKLPTILPRSSLPDSLSVRSSPPSLAPKDARGHFGPWTNAANAATLRG